jgi:hypothetical protein
MRSDKGNLAWGTKVVNGFFNLFFNQIPKEKDPSFRPLSPCLASCHLLSGIGPRARLFRFSRSAQSKKGGQIARPVRPLSTIYTVRLSGLLGQFLRHLASVGKALRRIN